MGSPITATAATALATLSGGAAVFLPTLTGCFAQIRSESRVKETFEELNRRLGEVESLCKNMSDHQYKLINEIVFTALQTVDPKKLDALQDLAVGSVFQPDLEEYEAVVLARTLRDISVTELSFVRSLNSFDEITVFNPTLDGFKPRKNQQVFENESFEHSLLKSLVAIGMLDVKETGFGGTENYHLTAISRRIIAMMAAGDRENSAPSDNAG